MKRSDRRPDLWLYGQAMPFWVERARDRQNGGFFDRLSASGEPYAEDPKTTLVQARMMFTCAHARLNGGGSECVDGAEAALAFLADHLRDPADGGFYRGVGRDGDPAAPGANRVKYAYDHSFVLLGLAAWLRLGASAEAQAMLDETFDWFHRTLFDPATGGYHEDDSVTRPSEPYPLPRRQNPHMHLFEALLALYEATSKARWLEHSRRILDVSRRISSMRKQDRCGSSWIAISARRHLPPAASANRATSSHGSGSCTAMRPCPATGASIPIPRRSTGSAGTTAPIAAAALAAASMTRSTRRARR